MMFLVLYYYYFLYGRKLAIKLKKQFYSLHRIQNTFDIWKWRSPIAIAESRLVSEGSHRWKMWRTSKSRSTDICTFRWSRFELLHFFWGVKSSLFRIEMWQPHETTFSLCRTLFATIWSVDGFEHSNTTTKMIRNESTTSHWSSIWDGLCPTRCLTWEFRRRSTKLSIRFWLKP
jgi:hypothetical protein